MALLNKDEKGRFISILGSDGSFREKVEKGTPGAVYREYEVKDSKTKETVKGSKHELVYNNIVGHIVGLDFFSGDYGQQFHVKISDGTDEVIWSQDVANQFTEDFLKKLPGVSLAHPVKLVPFAFTDDNGKNRKGVTIYQGETKHTDFFYDPTTKTKKHGFPVPEGDVENYDNDDWKVYFIKARKFLVEYTAKNVIPALGMVERVYEAPTPLNTRNSGTPTSDTTDDGINPDDIPF